jgi:group I intron endonuclease
MKRKNNMKERNYLIYKVTNTVDGSVYIGATTKKIEERKKDHIYKSNNEYRNDFHEAISTYGAEAFTWEQEDTAETIDILAQKEKEYIYTYNSLDKGYNTDSGGGFKKTVYQYNIDDGSLVATHNSLKEAGEVVNTTKQHISRACLSVNKKYKNYYWSYEYKVPFKADNDNRKKEVYQYTLDKEFIRKYTSVAEASRHCNLSKSTISRVCRGERKSGGGYYWEYNYTIHFMS